MSKPQIKSIDGTWHIWIEMRDFAYWRDTRYASTGNDKVTAKNMREVAPKLVEVWKRTEGGIP